MERNKLSEEDRGMKKTKDEKTPEEPKRQPRCKGDLKSARNRSMLLSSHTLSQPCLIWPHASQPVSSLFKSIDGFLWSGNL